MRRRLRRPAQHGRVQRDRHERQDHGEDDERIAPAVGVDQRLRERQEDEARQRGDQGQRRHRTPPLRRIGEPLREHDERRLVQHRSHHDADAEPDRIERGESVHLRPGEHQQRAGDRAGRHHPARAMQIEMAPDRDPRHGRHEQRERVGARQLRGAVAELALHRQQEHRERVVQDAPRDHLGDREGGDDPPRPMPAPVRSRRFVTARTPIDRHAHLLVSPRAAARSSISRQGASSHGVCS